MDWSEALHRASEPVLDDEVRALAALHAGRVRRSTRRLHAVAAASTVALAVTATWLLLPSSSPDTSVVVACAPGAGGQSAGAATAGGVSLLVRNTTSSVQPVSAGGTTALALPGESTVTLPLAAGHVQVRCGSGPAVDLTVKGLGDCHATESFPDTVETGRLADLTLAHVGAVPLGAVVDTGSGSRRVVRVRTGDKVIAEAVWHALPGDSDWNLQSFARCS